MRRQQDQGQELPAPRPAEDVLYDWLATRGFAPMQKRREGPVLDRREYSDGYYTANTKGSCRHWGHDPTECAQVRYRGGGFGHTKQEFVKIMLQQVADRLNSLGVTYEWEPCGPEDFAALNIHMSAALWDECDERAE